MYINAHTIAKAITDVNFDIAVTGQTKACAILTGEMHGSKVSLEFETQSDDKVSIRYHGHFVVSVSTELRMEVIISIINALLPENKGE